MKKLLLVVLTVTLGVLLPRAQAVDTLPFLGSIRSQVAVQLTIASNNVAATNDVKGNKKLISALVGAQKVIDRTKTNYVAGAKTLTVLNKSLGRTALSNEFNPLIDQTLDVYVGSLYSVRNILANRVNESYPGRSQTAALAALAKLLAAIDNANTNGSRLLALKALGVAARAEVAAQRATVKAENAPAPPSHFTATITGSGEGTVQFKPAGSLGTVAAARLGDSVQIIAQEVRISGSTVRQRVVNMGFPVSANGTFTYAVDDWGLNYITSVSTLGGSSSGDAFGAVSGTLTVTINLAAKSAIGTFSFSAPGDNNPGNVAQSSNGSFSVIWQ